MDLDHLTPAGIDASSAVGGDPFAAPAAHAPGSRARALAGLSAAGGGGMQFSWVFTTISAPEV
ncbi:hypothetical protein ACFQV2_32350 [Actinokineospora soli]|uniref:Uncharacterized protein n=1 Tax=Actinokineospora soli TaxID=1048753 RepID=A0ABW2TY97_9PSEU